MSTKGTWYPDRSKATDKDPPLYLHIAANTEDVLQHAIDKVRELIDMDLGSLVEDKKDRQRERVCACVLPPDHEEFTHIIAQMARGEASSWSRIDTKLQC